MKKNLIAVLLAVVLTLSATAFAATYKHDDDISFEYDETAFEITMDDHTDDEDLVILTGKDPAWGDTFIRIHLRDMEDGEKFPTMDEFTAMPDATNVSQGDWNGFTNVFMYTVEYKDGNSENYFIAPVMDEGKVDDILTVNVGVSRIDDEATLMRRDDLISAVLDSLKVSD